MTVGRYHSLVATSLPESLEVRARAAYLHELQNTRVVLRSQPPGTALPGK